MARKPRVQLFVVQGTGEWGRQGMRDMLRYDACRPLAAADQRVIDATYDDADDSVLWDERGHLRMNTVRLLTASRFAPTVDRWRSFTWAVPEGPRDLTFAEREEHRAYLRALPLAVGERITCTLFGPKLERGVVTKVWDNGSVSVELDSGIGTIKGADSCRREWEL